MLKISDGSIQYLISGACVYNNEQLLNEVEYDIENYQGQGLRYPPKLKAEVDNTNRDLDNSRYHTKTESNNCFIIYSKSDVNQL